MAISHANCTHPRTPAGRRACRAGAAPVTKDRTYGAPEIGIPYVVWPEGVSEAGYRKLVRAAGARHARNAPEKPARIQPRRGGARVPARSSTCVQAALHIAAHGGRCACGWVAA
jgi:hypothetical protein